MVRHHHWKSIDYARDDINWCIVHDDVIKWKHFPRYWPFVRGIHRSPVNSPHKGQWRGALMFTLIYARINGWVNNREAGDLRRYRAHYDVIVMLYKFLPVSDLAFFVLLNPCHRMRTWFGLVLFDYRNWYQYWGHHGLINDLGSSPQPKGEVHHSPRAKPDGCGEFPRSLMRPHWPKLRYQFLFYRDEIKSMMNKQMLSSVNVQNRPKTVPATAWLHVHIFGLGDLIASPL